METSQTQRISALSGLSVERRLNQAGGPRPAGRALFPAHGRIRCCVPDPRCQMTSSSSIMDFADGPRKRRPLAEFTVDYGTRPHAPRIEGATPEHRRRGRHLADVHKMYLRDIEEVGRILTEVEKGERDAAALAEAVRGLEMARNYRIFGTLCGRECHVLTIHHTIEDRQLFPVLAARGSTGLRAVVARLQEEHLVVHELIERLEEAAIALMTSPGLQTFAEARETFRSLEVVVRSHFGYEETELEEALGFHGIV